ncbi:MAG: phytanoyl-CoA dioxygenase family protein [Solirubrobacteraceae bacterium]
MFRRRSEKAGNTGTVARPEPPVQPLLEEIDSLQSRLDRSSDAQALRDLRDLRHRAGIGLLDSPPALRDYPEPSGSLPDPAPGAIPELSPGEISPGFLRAAILRNGCAIVRGLVPEDRARALAEDLDHIFRRRASDLSGSESGEGEDLLYEEFVPQQPYVLIERPWVYQAGGIWLSDSPRMMAEVFHLYERVGLRQLVSDFLGGRPVLSVNKSTLRRAHASYSRIDWHQDGAFMGEVRTLNVWLSLSDCGDRAPGLVMVPRRIERIVQTGTPGARFDWSVSPVVAEDEAGSAGIIHPAFAPGDAVLFDNFFLHATWVHDGMPDPRYALESWFFNPAAFPSEYVPLAF